MAPPAVAATLELVWVLDSAFGDRVDSGSDVDSVRVEELATALDLTSRIGARVPSPVLQEELGAGVTERFRTRFRQTGARMVGLEAVARRISEMAAGAGMPAVFLKGMALLLQGSVTPGKRRSSDVDVLVPEAGARELQGLLMQAGWSALDTPEIEHQLQALEHPSGLSIEVHKLISGVRLDAGGIASARFDDLEREQLLERLEGFPGRSFIPGQDLLVAHLLVHGLAQHGRSLSYPLLRMIADLEDLALSEEQWRGFMAGPYTWIARDVTEDLAWAAWRLARRLQAGEAGALLVESSDEGTLLRHIVAGALDHQYVQSLRIGSVLGALPAGNRWRKTAVTLFHAVWLTRGQVDILYGRPKSALGYAAWRAWRPFDLVVRGLRYARAWLHLRARRQG